MLLNFAKLVTSNIYKEKKGNMKNLDRIKGVDPVSKQIDWGKFSTYHSTQAVIYCLNEIKVISPEYIADKIHDNWMTALLEMWDMVDNQGYNVKGGYSTEKRESHKKMLVPFEELDTENKLKDIYVLKDILENHRTKEIRHTWKELDRTGYYEPLFKKYNIGW